MIFLDDAGSRAITVMLLKKPGNTGLGGGGGGAGGLGATALAAAPIAKLPPIVNAALATAPRPIAAAANGNDAVAAIATTGIMAGGIFYTLQAVTA